MTKKFSIVIPSYNEGDHIRRTVNSILHHGYTDLLEEVIVIDDASTDNSGVHLQDVFMGKVPQVALTVIRKKERAGAIRCRNEGAEMATGDYLVFLDGHMAIESKDWLWSLQTVLDQGNTMATGLLLPLDEPPDEDVRGSLGCTLNDWLQLQWLSPDRAKRRWQYHVPACPGGYMAVRREEFMKFDEGLKTWGFEDMELSIRWRQYGGDIVAIPDNAALRHRWAGSRSHVGWPVFIYNLCRTATMHFHGKRLAAILEAAAKMSDAKYVRDAVVELSEDKQFAQQVVYHQQKRLHDGDWYWENYIVDKPAGDIISRAAPR